MLKTIYDRDLIKWERWSEFGIQLRHSLILSIVEFKPSVSFVNWAQVSMGD